ncbi:hypothetical protein MPS_2590 [Mycobacterium pseudoshottsii JCM 15466]|nr:hypothetical protein MPS_2590 [Mycobacterium pseudoshottsii JCM 15466]
MGAMAAALPALIPAPTECRFKAAAVNASGALVTNAMAQD